jgi:hypothetical protein
MKSESFLGEFQHQQFSKTVISRVLDVQKSHALYVSKPYEIIYNFYLDQMPRFCR